jgi:carbonic anhydrase
MRSDLRDDLRPLFEHNRLWAQTTREEDPSFFEDLAKQQAPQFLWIGCADSRVPANEIIGLKPGEVFVHRNVANIISLTDLNCLSSVQYAVETLKVVHIIVCGHYGCGGVQAALNGNDFGLVTNWLSPIADAVETHRDALDSIKDPIQQADKLCEINVIQQVRNLCRSSFVRKAWLEGQDLAVHGMIYGMQDGILHDLRVNIVGVTTADAICHLAMERILAIPGRIVD